MNTQPTKTILATALLLALPMLASAAVINLVGNDASGTSSFNSGQNWAGGLAPSAANDYNTAGFFMRTPGDNTNNETWTFRGGSLTLGPCNLSGGVNGSILEKFGQNVVGDTRTLVINNFTNTAGAMIRSGGTAGALIHVSGNHYTMAGSSIIQADQCIWVIDSPLLGGDNIILTNFANNANDHVSYDGTNSGFTGSWYLTGAGTSAWSLELDGVSSLPGNPSTFNPGQITFLGTGQLRDTVGCALTNSNGGITFAANATINTSATTLIGEPITDVTNGFSSVSSLTSTSLGTLILSNANNTYSGGTIISSGTLQLGVTNAIPAPATAGLGDVTDNGTLDLNANSAKINGLNGSGTVDTVAGGTPTLTIGANGDSGTFSGTIQNSSGALSVTKVGAGTETFTGAYLISGVTTVANGILNVSTASGSASTPGSFAVGNGNTMTANTSLGNPLAVNNLVVGTNSTLNLILSPTAVGVNAAGTLTFQDNATNNFNYGTVIGNPTFAAINTAGSISASGSNIVINIAATGLKTGTFTLIQYTGTALTSIANFHVSPPPGVAGFLVNDTANHSIDIQITQIPNVLSWSGVNGTAWDLSTPNWLNTVAGGITVFQQYTNNGVVAGDAVTFDDTLTNDFVNPQPTNIVLNSTFFAFPVVATTSLPYSIAGAGGIAGVTSLTVSNSAAGSGSLTLLTSNSFSGGVNIADAALIITNDFALGATNGPVTLNGGTLQYNGSATNNVRAFSLPVASTIDVSGNNTVRLGGSVSGAGVFYKADTGTLILAHNDAIAGNVFLHGGTTIIDTGGAITNANYDDVGQDTNDAATLTLRNTGSFSTTSDFNLGDLGASVGTLNMQNTATLTVNALFIGSANASGSTAMGTVNQSGGTVTEVSTAIGEFDIGGRTSVSGVGVYNISSGTVTANAGIRVGSTGIGTLNQSGGIINAKAGINIARIAGSFGTNNLNGGTLSTLNIASSTSTNDVFNFNGGILQANFSPTAPWFQSGIQANVLAGGAIIDSSNNSVGVFSPLLAGSANGGLTKLGTGTLTLNGINTFTGPITNNAGTLSLNSASTYAGALVINAGTLQMTTASTIQGGTTIGNGAVLAVNQIGSANTTFANLTFNGSTNAPGATLALAPTLANNPAVPMVVCSSLTLNGTNTISLPIESVGTIALIKYTGAIAGNGNCTNLSLPQGASGFISNSATASTLFAVVTSTGPGIVWAGTNSVAGKTNLWDISSTINWLLNTTPTTYHQVVIPGDLVTFNDSGSGTVLLSNNVGPTSMIISNNSKTYTFSGSGSITGPTGIQKLGSGTAIINLTNATYLGATVVSNGTLQVGSTSALSATANVNIGTSGTLELAGNNLTAGELTGSGVVDNNVGIATLLTIAGSGGTWNGTIQDQGHNGIGLINNGTGTWVVGGANKLDNGSPFTTTNEFNGGITILTNGGSITVPILQTVIAYGSGNATMIIGGGTLILSNDVLAVGYNAGATGTLIVNSGTVNHGGGAQGNFGGANELIVGDAGGTGLLTVNGGQVLNSQALWLGEGAGASGTLQLNGGLVQASQVTGNTTPTTSLANFNGGILQANTNSTDFIDISTIANIQTGGLILDDGGWAINIPNNLQPDQTLLGGGLIKQGAGAVYLDGGNSYTGTTLVTNGLLAGVGIVSGPVVVAPAGNIGAGDAGGMGQFSVYNNLTIQGGATMRISVTGNSPQQDQIYVSGNITYGGVLTVMNTTSDSTVLANGNTFQLFSISGSHAGNFSSINGSPGAGLGYSFDPTTGYLSVITQTIAPNPTNILFNVSGNTLTLSWPADHQGWILQAQTNSLSAGLTTAAGNWFDIPGSGSATSSAIIMNPTNPTVFYRLRRPF